MSIVRETILHELRDAQKKAVEFVRQKNDALTPLKKDYFAKKLIKNNRKALELLEALNRLPLDVKKNDNEPAPVSEPKQD